MDEQKKVISAEKRDTVDDSGRRRRICKKHGVDIEYITYYQFGECPLCMYGQYY